MKKLFLLVLIAVGLAPTLAGAQTILNDNPYQGEAVVVQFASSEKPTYAEFAGKSVPVFPYHDGYRAVFGVETKKKSGSYSFKANLENGQKYEKEIKVRGGISKHIVLPVPPKLNITPTQLTQKLAVNNASINDFIKTIRPDISFIEPFGLPLRDNTKIASRFGEVRQTGNQQIMHLGTDFDQPLGSAVAAINTGIVKKAYVDSVYGNSIIVDHGAGIYSLYLHLDKMLVKDGDKVRKGMLVGRLGQSGLASAPHLHLSIKINGQSVDPVQFVKLFK